MAKIDGKQEITKALWESGFHADPRSEKCVQAVRQGELAHRSGQAHRPARIP